MPERDSRQVTHLALTLEFLFLLEGQGAGEHGAGVVEAVLDNMFVLVGEPGGGCGLTQEGREDRLLSPLSLLLFHQKPTGVPTCQLYNHCTGPWNSFPPPCPADWGLPEGRAPVHLRYLKPEPYLPPLIWDLPSPKLGLLP